MNKNVEKILNPYLEGKNVIILQGRELQDLDLNEEGIIQPLIEILRKETLRNNNLILVRYSLSSGVNYDLSELNREERDNVTKILCDLSIYNTNVNNSDDTEVIRIMRGLLKLGQTKHGLKLRDGKELKFLIIFEFSEHLLPQLQNGTHTTDMKIAIELSVLLSKSLAVRKSGNYIIFSETRKELMQDIIYQNIPVVNMLQPDSKEKQKFICALRQRYPNTKFENGLTDQIVSIQSSGTPNRSLESIFLASEKTGEVILEKDIFEKKQKDIICLSENTLEAIDQNRIKNQKLIGRTILKPLQLLNRLTIGLKNGDPNCLRNICLSGAPSTGKTIMANIAAVKAGIPAFILNSPKDMYVGETERKTRLMLSLLKEQGGIGIIDEMEHIFPLNRNNTSNDSGVTANLMGQLNSFLSDPSLSGKVAIIGTSNRPNAISEAMRQRWVILPVLMPLKEDYPDILLSIAKGLNQDINLNGTEERLKEISERFYSAGVSPREIREVILAIQISLGGSLCIEHIEYASTDIITGTSRISSIYSDYCTLFYCRNNSYLPWWDEDKYCPSN